MYITHRGRRFFFVHAYRDGRGKACQQRLGHFVDGPGLERLLDDIPMRYPELEWDYAQLRHRGQAMLRAKAPGPTVEARADRLKRAARRLRNLLADEDEPEVLRQATQELQEVTARLAGAKNCEAEGRSADGDPMGWAEPEDEDNDQAGWAEGGQGDDPETGQMGLGDDDETGQAATDQGETGRAATGLGDDTEPGWAEGGQGDDQETGPAEIGLGDDGTEPGWAGSGQGDDDEAAEEELLPLVERHRNACSSRRKGLDERQEEARAYLRALDRLGDLYLRQGRLEDCLQVVRERVARCPSTESRVLLAATLQRLGFYSEAVRQYSYLPTEDPRRYYNSAAAFWAEGHYEESLEQILQGVKRQSEVAEVMLRRYRGGPGADYWREYADFWPLPARRFLLAACYQTGVRWSLLEARQTGIRKRHLISPRSKAYLLEHALAAVADPNTAVLGGRNPFKDWMLKLDSSWEAPRSKNRPGPVGKSPPPVGIRSDACE